MICQYNAGGVFFKQKTEKRRIAAKKKQGAVPGSSAADRMKKARRQDARFFHTEQSGRTGLRHRALLFFAASASALCV